MEHDLFKPKTLEESKNTVVGDCNGFTMQQRWDAETPVFAKRILELAGGPAKILDYGCGCGRLAKEILKQNESVSVVGVDASDTQMEHASKYVGSSRFATCKPQDLSFNIQSGHFDLIYCVYVLQHCPAVDLRSVLERIHYSLKDEGCFVYCSSDYRMAIRFDGQGFQDDRFLGVNIREEISRLFEEVAPLFDEKTLNENEIVKKMVTGCDGGLSHPAFVYKKRKLSGPYFDAQVQQQDVKPTVVVQSVVKEPDKFQKLLLLNRLAPGDILVMTNALRDLHKAHPGKYKTDVRTPCSEIFNNNPYITKLDYDNDQYESINNRFSQLPVNAPLEQHLASIGDILLIDMHYPLIHTSGTCGWHFSYGHRDWLEQILNVKIPQTAITPEIYLSQDEVNWISPVLAETGWDKPYWVINAGSKNDYTLKQYPFYQQVVDLLKDKVKFVQIGITAHSHSPLTDVISMIGKTKDTRKLLRVIKHAQGVVSCVSFPMHIAAAFKKPCVVVAGAREGTRWELYPNQQFLYVNGCLPCADYDGCWKSKNEECTNRVNGVAKCMTLIRPEDVVRSVNRYYEGGMLKF